MGASKSRCLWGLGCRPKMSMPLGHANHERGVWNIHQPMPTYSWLRSPSVLASPYFQPEKVLQQRILGACCRKLLHKLAIIMVATIIKKDSTCHFLRFYCVPSICSGHLTCIVSLVLTATQRGKMLQLSPLYRWGN